MGKLIVGVNDLYTKNRVLAEQWHPTMNGSITPHDVAAGSKQKAWWTCALDHSWDAIILSRSQGNGCPICAGKRVLIGFNDLYTKNRVLAEQWHPTRNGEFTPHDFTSNSHRKAHWECSLGHSWEATIDSRSQGNGCPICAGKRVLIGFNDLGTTNPELIPEWHPTRNGEFTPRDFTSNSGCKAHWECAEGHSWEARIADRSKGNGCPICAGKRVLIGFNELHAR